MNEFALIESVEFETNFSVISSFKIFQIALEENDTLRQLIEKIKDDPRRRQRVAARITSLLSVENDPELMHPHDVSIAAYLFVLSKVDPLLARLKAKELVGIPNLWWTRRLSTSFVETLTTEIGQVATYTMKPLEVSKTQLRLMYRADAKERHENHIIGNYRPATVILAGTALPADFQFNIRRQLVKLLEVRYADAAVNREYSVLPDDMEDFEVEKVL